MPPIQDPAMLAQIQQQQAQRPMTLATPPMSGAPLINPQKLQAQNAEAARLRLSEQNAARSAQNEAARIALAQKADARAQAEFAEKYTIPPAPGDTTKTGDEYLKTIPENIALQVKAMAEGRRPFPTGAALRNQQNQMLIAAATQFDPSLDATDVATRIATRKDFTSGKSMQNIRALNTVIGHVGSLYEAAKRLENTSSPLLNAPKNWAKSNVAGDPAIKDFNLARNAVADELERVFRGTGGNVTEIEQWKESLSSSSSPEQFKQVMATAMELLNSRLEAMQTSYNAGMKRSVDPLEFLTPKNRALFEALSTQHDPEEQKQISTTEQQMEIPQGYKDEHKQFLIEHAGSLTVPQYLEFRKAMDAKYTTPEKSLSTQYSPEDVKAFVDEVNQGSGVTKPIPTTSRKLSEDERKRAEFAASGPGVGAVSALNAASFGGVDALLPDEQQHLKDQAASAHPWWEAGGEMAGSIMPMAITESAGKKMLEKLAPNLTPTARQKFLTQVASNAAYGGERGFMGADTGEGAMGAVEGTAAGALGAAGGQAVTKGVTPLLSEGTTKALTTLKGVKPTTLQKLGLGHYEESLSGVPFSHGAREKALESFNRNNANRALSYIGETVPKNVPVGTEMNSFVNQKLSNAYNTIRPQITGTTDGAFDNAITAIRAKANTPEKKAMLKEIDETIKMFRDKTTGSYSGDGYKEASERLRHLVKAWTDTQSSQGSVAAGDMAKLAEQTRKNMQTLIQRKQPDVGAKLKQVERGWAHSMRIEDASNRALANSEARYSPGQYLTSLKKLDTSAHKGASARGKAFDQVYAEAGAKILGPGNVPKLSPKETAIALGIFGGAGYMSPAAAGVLGAIAAGLYGPGPKQIVQAALVGTRPKAVDNDIVRRIISDELRHKMTGD